jgi:diacylglycerol kinase (ATP)
MQSPPSRRAVRANKNLNILVILNGISGKRKKFINDYYPALQEEFQVELQLTEYSGHAEQLAGAAVHKGYDIIFAAGGDGTMSQVVNGVLSSGKETLPTVGLIPLGSGNDLARSLNVAPNVEAILGLIRNNKPRDVDIGDVTLDDKSGKTIRRYFINECSIGMGPDVVRRINEGSVVYGASITYLKAIVATFFTNKPERINIKATDFEWEGEARVLAVANGKAFGHSIYIAPDAELNDGKLNMFLCKGLPLVKFLLYLQAIKQPKKIDDRKWIEYKAIEKISIGSPKALPVEADGELIGFTPAVCGVLQKKIKLLA